MQVKNERKSLIKEFVEDLNELLETDQIYDILLHKKEKWKKKLED